MYTEKHLVAAAGITVLVIALALAYEAVSFEITGRAFYYLDDEGSAKRFVTRSASPAEFREVVKVTCEISACSFLLALGSFIAYRKLSD